jgi:WD40 repeat protein
LQGHEGQVYCVAFLPGGAKLVSGSIDGTALIWNLSEALRAVGDSRPDDERAFLELGNEDPAIAYRAVAELVARPEQLMALGRRLAIPSNPRVRDLIAQLSSEVVERREAAHRELERLGDEARPDIAVAVRQPPASFDDDTRQRLAALARILDVDVQRAATLSDERRRRASRMVHALEWMGTNDARALLRQLALGGDASEASSEALIRDTASASQPAPRSSTQDR